MDIYNSNNPVGFKFRFKPFLNKEIDFWCQNLRVHSGTGNVCEIPAKRFSGRDIATCQKLSCSGTDSTSCRLYLGPDNARQLEFLLWPSISSRLRDRMWHRVLLVWCTWSQPLKTENGIWLWQEKWKHFLECEICISIWHLQIEIVFEILSLCQFPNALSKFSLHLLLNAGSFATRPELCFHEVNRDHAFELYQGLLVVR